MKAIVMRQFGDASVLHLEDMPKPIPKEDEVLIQVEYAGVNHIDWKIREGLMKEMMPYTFPIIPGWDVSGVIVECGKKVKDLKIGDEVFAFVKKPIIQWGAYAEYIAFTAEGVALKPKFLSFAQAATLPLASLAAWEALVDIVKLKKSETIFIHGGSGSVGAMAIQLAKHIGATVITTSGPKKRDYMQQLGADFVVDYKGNFGEKIREYIPEGVDVVFDCYDKEQLDQAAHVLKKRGRLVSILKEFNASLAKLDIDTFFLSTHPDSKESKTIAKWFEQKKFQPLPLEEMPLSQAAQAQEKQRLGDASKKIALKVR